MQRFLIPSDDTQESEELPDTDYVPDDGDKHEDHTSTSMSRWKNRPLVLLGLGGVGKTELATEYAHRHKGYYETILWINCRTRLVFQERIKHISRALGPESLSRDSWDLSWMYLSFWLQARKRPWLIVLDDVEDGTVLQDVQLPRNHRGSIIITTRSRLAAEVGIELPVEPLTPSDGAELLLSLIGQKEYDRIDRTAALNLSELLGGLPLALSQVARNIRGTSTSLTMCLADFRAVPNLSRTHGKYDLTLSSTYLLSFKRLSPGSFRLMGVLSVLDPDKIPHVLLSEYAVSVPMRELV
ncbi:P-loop containing nucleoside triphosphate hydrolase protein [Aspergillus pseudodeflectus]|uniref:P-loop containing nucleoside triphosphate hydrolase protein n=1 Tax=Aspergillus pseudodeflectus TaxID=176178 RepID=A0ABR4JNL4_9EURO